ncbi:MAG: hypothetical protein VX986_03465 [Pseudomonadota bacterium]|nr:hypothetical protein [Pseudomonadota bacterium]
MSFLDVISCGFGAVVMLVIIAKDSDMPLQVIESNKSNIELKSDHNKREILSESIRVLRVELETLSEKEESLRDRLDSVTDQIKQKNNGTTNQVKATSEKSLSPDRKANLGTLNSIYAGGIPVDRQHIVFIIDTSGSMKRFWRVVESQIQSILSIHPQVKGLQIMNDNGDYLLEGYSSKWIPDTKITRQRVAKKLKTWAPFSNSNPYKGLVKTLRHHTNESGGISIYVMGDDFTGASYDEVLTTIGRLNRRNKTETLPAQIHGIAFPWGIGDRFSTLMRELALQNGGVFVTVHHPLQQ